MPLTLRPAVPADLPVVVAIMNSAYRGSEEDASWNRETGAMEGDRTSEADLAEDIAGSPGAALLVAEEDGELPIRGCVFLKPLAGATWYLGSLTVDPRIQNAGLGRSLLRAAEDWAGRQGATRIQMDVMHVREPLIAWYRRRGYAPTGETHPFPYGETRFGRPLRDDLVFVVLEKGLQPGAHAAS